MGSKFGQRKSGRNPVIARRHLITEINSEISSSATRAEQFQTMNTNIVLNPFILVIVEAPRAVADHLTGGTYIKASAAQGPTTQVVVHFNGSAGFREEEKLMFTTLGLSCFNEITTLKKVCSSVFLSVTRAPLLGCARWRLCWLPRALANFPLGSGAPRDAC